MFKFDPHLELWPKFESLSASRYIENAIVVNLYICNYTIAMECLDCNPRLRLNRLIARLAFESESKLSLEFVRMHGKDGGKVFSLAFV